MYVSCARLLVLFALTALTVTACGGNASHTTPAQPNSQTAGMPQSLSAVVPLSAAGGTFTLPLAGSYSGTITLRASGVAPGSTMTLQSTGSTTSAGLSPQDVRPCPSIPPIQLVNPNAFPLVIELDAFQMSVPCNINGKLFAAGVYQLKPVPPVLSVMKIGDARGVGDDLQFTPTVTQLTLPANSIEVLVFSLESTTSGVPIPVVPGVTTVLTTGNTSVPTTLSFKFTSAQGGSIFTSSCANAFSGTTLNPQLQGVPLVGTPSFFCHLDPGSTFVTFGAPINFYIGVPKPDASVLGLDGPSSTFVCQPPISIETGTTTPCGTPAFTISNTSTTAFKNVLVSNVQDLRMCVPATENTDCNALVNPAPSRTTVPSGRAFQLLVADDPTYRPGVGPWDGLFRSTVVSGVNGPCHFPNISTDSVTVTSSPAPATPSPTPLPSFPPDLPGYSDNGQVGVGPQAEFDVVATGSGVCTIKMTEDARFITADFSNPQAPVGRSVQLSVTIQQSDE